MERRIPCLDGLRGVSILLVLAAHATGTRDLLTGERLGDLDALGNLGVRVFFVISGFLITTLLLTERRATGTIALVRFFARRALRILPAAYVYVGVMFALAAAGLVTLAPGDRIHALTYTVNYHHLRSWYVSHLWSLSVEEQFYLLWPVVLALLGTRRGLWAAAAMLLVSPAVRVLIWLYWPERRIEIGEAFTTIADALAAGCVLAGIRPWLSRRPGYLRLVSSRWVALVPLAAVAANGFQRYVFIDFVVGETVMNVAIAVTIDACVRQPGSAVGRLLEGRLLVGLGLLSYSLYLWQEPFLNRFSRSSLAAFPLNVALAIAAALASYWLVERPLIAARRRLRAARSPGA